MTTAFRKSFWHKGATWLLIAGILMQPVINFLVTPWVSLDSRGHYVLICTLEGLKEVLVEDFGDGAVEEEPPCPALELFKLVGSATPAAPFEHAPSVSRAVATTADKAERPQLSRQYQAYSIRAPPIV